MRLYFVRWDVNTSRGHTRVFILKTPVIKTKVSRGRGNSPKDGVKNAATEGRWRLSAPVPPLLLHFVAQQLMAQPACLLTHNCSLSKVTNRPDAPTCTYAIPNTTGRRSNMLWRWSKCRFGSPGRQMNKMRLNGTNRTACAQLRFMTCLL